MWRLASHLAATGHNDEHSEHRYECRDCNPRILLDEHLCRCMVHEQGNECHCDGQLYLKEGEGLIKIFHCRDQPNHG